MRVQSTDACLSNAFRQLSCCSVPLLGGIVLAGPSIAPGDLALRHDIQRLDDYGVLSGPVTTWPLSWGPILSDRQIHQPTAE